METKPLIFTYITADIVTDADTDADVMEMHLYSFNLSVRTNLNKCVAELSRFAGRVCMIYGQIRSGPSLYDPK